MKCTNPNCKGSLSLDLSIEDIPYYRGDSQENPGQIELNWDCSANCGKFIPPFTDPYELTYWVINNYDKIGELNG